MMKSKKKLMTGFAIAASLLAGCQTAQKNSANEVVSDAFLNEPSTYGADRTPAGGQGPIGELFKLIKESAHTDQRLSKDIQQFLAQVNKDNKTVAYQQELKEARANFGGKFTEKNIGSLDPVLQARLVEDFLRTSKYKNVSKFSDLKAEVSKIVAQGKASGVEEMRVGAKGGGASQFRNGLLSAGTKGLDANGEVTASREAAMKKYYLKNVYEAAIRENPEAYATVEGKAALTRALKAAKEYHEITGVSIITNGTCKNLDLVATTKYAELLEQEVAMAKQLKAEGKLMCPEVEAWVAARFQEALGRAGIAAYTAVEEMAVCDYMRPETAKASRSLASSNEGRVPGSPPSCK